MGCQKLVEYLGKTVGKTDIPNILEDSGNLLRDYEFFKGSYIKSVAMENIM